MMGDVIILKAHANDSVLRFPKKDYVLAESRDVIQILPIHDQDRIRTFYKPFWKVVKQ